MFPRRHLLAQNAKENRGIEKKTYSSSQAYTPTSAPHATSDKNPRQK